MWGWEDSACVLCGAPYCMCNCNEQLKTINTDLKAIRDDLIKRTSVSRKEYVSPDFLIALRNSDGRRELLRALAVEIPEVIIAHAFLHDEITYEESLEIYKLRDEASVSWLTKKWRKLCESF